MDYKITRATAKIGQIEVAYMDGDKIVGIYAIDVPVVGGAFITGEALETLIQQQAPVWLAKREQDVASATGFDQIEALVTPVEAFAPDAQELANQQMWAQVQFEKQVADVLVKFGVLQSNPTTIESTTL